MAGRAKSNVQYPEVELEKFREDSNWSKLIEAAEQIRNAGKGKCFFTQNFSVST